MCMQVVSVREPLAGVTFEAGKLHWLMSHPSFVLLYFICCEWPLFSCCCFKTKKKKKSPLYKCYICLFGLEGCYCPEKKSWINFSPTQILEKRLRLQATLMSAPTLKLGSSLLPRVLGGGSKSFHRSAEQTLRSEIPRGSPLQENGPLPLPLLASADSDFLPEAKWQYFFEAWLSCCFRVKHFRASIVLPHINWVGVPTTSLIE